MKRLAICVAVFLLAGLAVAQEKLPPRVVRVIGTADLKVVPDRAQIELGVQKQDASASVAKRAADAAARQILATLRANGIDEKDVQTTFVSLQPQYDYRRGKRLSAFLATQTMTVTVRSLAKLDALLENLITAGGNQINSIEYEVSDSRKYRDQARELAVEAAREKAVALAKALGQEIGNAYSIEEVPQYNYGYGGLTANASFEMDKASTRSGPATAPGQNTVSASVVVTFDLK